MIWFLGFEQWQNEQRRIGSGNWIQLFKDAARIDTTDEPTTDSHTDDDDDSDEEDATEPVHWFVCEIEWVYSDAAVTRFLNDAFCFSRSFYTFFCDKLSLVHHPCRWFTHASETNSNELRGTHTACKPRLDPWKRWKPRFSEIFRFFGHQAKVSKGLLCHKSCRSQKTASESEFSKVLGFYSRRRFVQGDCVLDAKRRIFVESVKALPVGTWLLSLFFFSCTRVT